MVGYFIPVFLRADIPSLKGLNYSSSGCQPGVGNVNEMTTLEALNERFSLRIKAYIDNKLQPHIHS